MADVSPASRTDDWATTILGKLRQVGDTARAVKADAVLDGGDFFHIKSPTRNSHEIVRRVAELHAEYPCPVYANVGNHDLKYGSLEFLDESPLSVLYSSGVFKRLYDNYEAVFVDEHGGVKVRVVGIPYHGTKYDWNRFTAIAKGDEDFLVVVAHCLASPTGGTLFDAEDVIGYKQLVNLDPDVWCFGHWHKNQGTKEIARGKYVVNIGSLSRGSLSQDDLTRTPECMVMRFAHGCDPTFEPVPLKVAAPEDVFNLAERDRNEARKNTMETVVDKLKDSLAMRESGSILDAVRQSAVEEGIRERTIMYLEQAGAR